MQLPVLQTLAAAPLIDFDYTFFVQLGIFLVTALAASALLFKPYMRLREERVEAVEGSRGEAERMSAEADSKLAGYEEKLAGARTRARDEQRKIRAEAAEHEREVTDRARSEAQGALDAARARVQIEANAARSELLPRAESLAVGIVSKLLGRKVA